MNIYNVIILDESGSMSSIYRETLQSLNEVLSGILKNQEKQPEQQHNVTIVTFEGNGIKGVKTRRDRIARFYYVSGHYGEVRKIAPDRDLVIWETASLSGIRQ